MALNGFTFVKEKVDGYGELIGDRDVLWPGFLKFHYELRQPRPGRKPRPVSVAYQGGVQEMPPSEAEAKVTHILHYVEIACAELCGLGHYKMKARLTIEPRFLYDAWLKESAEFEPPEMDKYRDIWDQFHPEFNDID